MKKRLFIIYGAIFIFFNMIGSSLLISTYLLLGLYFILAAYAAVLTIKYKSTNPLVLLVVTLYLIGYIWIDWVDKTVIYIPNGMHSLVGFSLIIFGVFFAKRFRLEEA